MLLVFLFFEVTTFQRAVQGLLALLLGIGGRASVYIYIYIYVEVSGFCLKLSMGHRATTKDSFFE